MSTHALRFLLLSTGNREARSSNLRPNLHGGGSSSIRGADGRRQCQDEPADLSLAHVHIDRHAIDQRMHQTHGHRDTHDAEAHVDTDMCMCVYVYVCMYVYTYICINLNLYMCFCYTNAYVTHNCTYMQTYMHTCMHICMCLACLPAA